MASNKALVPEAKKALDQFKMEAATEVGVTLNQGYNGDLTARQAGSIGGQMVKKMIQSYDRHAGQVITLFPAKAAVQACHKSATIERSWRFCADCGALRK